MRRSLALLAMLVLGVTVTVGTSAPPPPYFVGDFESGISPPWSHAPSNRDAVRVTDPVGQGRYALRETVTSASAGPNASSDAVFVWNDANSSGGYHNVGQTTWYHVLMRFPGGGAYKPSAGNWNWNIEHHNDRGYRKWACASAEKANLSFGVWTDSAGNNAHEQLRVMGGPSCTPSMHLYDWGPLQLDHWYNVLYEVKWDPSSAGFVKLWVDGAPKAAYVGPTLFTRPDGTISYTNEELNNYRSHATWNSTIYYDNFRSGPSAASVE